MNFFFSCRTDSRKPKHSLLQAIETRYGNINPAKFSLSQNKNADTVYLSAVALSCKEQYFLLETSDQLVT